MPTTTGIKRQPLSRIVLRKSPRETPEEFERRSRQFNDFREFKMRNFPRVTLVLPTESLLLSDIVKYPVTPCNQQRRLQFRPQIIFTKGPFATSTATDRGMASDASTGSVTPELTATTTGTGVTDTTTSPVLSELTATTIDTPSSPVSPELTATTTSTDRPTKLYDKELVQKLQERNPALDLSKYLIHQKTHLDFGQYLIQTPRHQADADSEEMAVGIIKELLENLELCDENGNNECENKCSETGIKATKFQRFGRSLKSLKTRITRAMTPLTSCFRLKSMRTAD